MTVIGDPALWAGTFPEDLVPRLLDLVTETWADFERPGETELEVPITRRFKRALKQAKDYRKLPVRIEREATEDDPDTGKERGRIDLKFLPAVSAREEVYFAFECKRLNAVEDRHRRTLAPEYVTDGMMRFVTGQYAATMLHGGMIGYVLDGRCADAIRLVERNIASRSVELKMEAPAALAKSALGPENDMIRETTHLLGRSFRLHHVFLGHPARRQAGLA
jgi:hypothetical protein